MLNPKGVIYASIALSLSCTAFADQHTQTTLPSQKLQPAYSAPSQVELNRSWNAQATASFLYWEAIESNLDMGLLAKNTSSFSRVDGTLLKNSTEYDPGFQVSLGFNTNYDGWDTDLEYTWFHTKQRTSKTPDSDEVIYPLWIAPSRIQATRASQTWKLDFDSLDWVIGRSSQIGKRLSLRPFFGLRAAWIDQKISATYTTTNNTRLFKATSDSWGIGPKFGLCSKWLLGKEFRFYADLSADVLYTRYSNLRSLERIRTSTGSINPVSSIREQDLSTIRPHLDSELGLGWGSHFGKRSWYFDLSLGYGFQVFWDQQMFRQFLDDLDLAASLSHVGNLYIQGLTAKATFHF